MLDLPDAKVIPRPYQCEAILNVLKEFEDLDRRSTLLVLPTGTGKTICFMLVARFIIEECGGRVLVIAHRGELITQACNAAVACGLTPTVEKADQHARPDLTKEAAQGVLFGDSIPDPYLVIASVQTMQRKRLKAWPPGHFDLVITDEAHHAAARSYRSVIDHLKTPRHLGVTATWDRGDKKPIVGEQCVFQSLAFEYSMFDAVEQGYLARPWFECLPTDIDLKDIRTTAGDYNTGDLEVLIKPHIEVLVNAMRPSLEGHRFLVFTPDTGSADAVASALCSVGVSCASLNGESKDRDEVVAAFRMGRYQGLSNCQLFTEGTDFPFVDVVVIMRPTKSRGFFTQMAGRATRIHPGKTECRIVGFNWHTLDHKLVNPVELFDGPDVDKKALNDAKQMVMSGDEADLQLALKKSIVARKEKARIQLAIEDRKRKCKSYRYDPLVVDGKKVIKPEWDRDGFSLTAMASAKQIARLEQRGYKANEVVDWSMARASQTLDELAKRQTNGLSTKKQIDFLMRLGYPNGAALGFHEASAEIDRRIKANKAKQPEVQPRA